MCDPLFLQCVKLNCSTAQRHCLMNKHSHCCTNIIILTSEHRYVLRGAPVDGTKTKKHDCCSKCAHCWKRFTDLCAETWKSWFIWIYSNENSKLSNSVTQVRVFNALNRRVTLIVEDFTCQHHLHLLQALFLHQCDTYNMTDNWSLTSVSQTAKVYNIRKLSHSLTAAENNRDYRFYSELIINLRCNHCLCPHTLKPDFTVEVLIVGDKKRTNLRFQCL